MRGKILLAFCFLTTVVVGQNLNFIHYNTNNSKLPHDIIYGIKQDKKGYLWISTDDGLVRFDGLQMVNYDNGLASKYVISTDEEDDYIWISTWKGGIHRLRGDSMEFVNSTLPVSLQSTNRILAFNNLIIVHYFDIYYVYRLDRKDDLLKPYSLKLKPDSSHTVHPAHEEYYKFIKTTSHRLFAYNNKGIFEVINEKLVVKSDQIQPDEIWQSPEGKMFYRLGAVIYACNEDFTGSRIIYTIPLHQLDDKKIHSFRVLPSGNMCVGFIKSDPNISFYLINVRTGDFFNLAREVRTESALAFATIDKEGGIWMGTDGGGLYHVFDLKYRLLGNENVFRNSHITALHLYKDGRLYIGSKKGVYTYDGKILKRHEGFKENAAEHIKKFFLTETEELAASVKTLERSNEVSGSTSKQLDYLERYNLTNYLIITDVHSTKIIDKKTGEDYVKSRKFSMPNQINTFVEDDAHNLWFGGNTGLYVFNRHQGFEKSSAITKHSVNALLYEENVGIWVGTSNGLFLIAKDGGTKYWGLEEGLSNLNVNCIHVQSAGSVWVGTQNGLFHLFNNQLYIYKKRNGLIADDVRCFAALPGGELAVGSSKGLTFFYMAGPELNLPAPELLMEKILINGHTYTGRNEIEVPYNSTLTFKYNAVSLVYPELMSFEYRLKNDDLWIKTQNKSLVFTNLDPGNYEVQFRVKNYNNSYSSILLFPLKIEFPWWRRWYFYLTLTLGLVVVTFYFFNKNLQKQKETARSKQQLAELKLKALQAQLNPHFISNSLNAIQYYMLKEDEKSANQYLTQFAELTRLVLETSRSSFIPLSTELEILKLYLSLEKLRFENKFDFKLDIEPGLDLSKIFIPGMLVQPFAENSVNHGIGYLEAGKTGKLLISMSMQDGFLKVVVDDNGIGRSRALELKSQLKKTYRSVSTEIVEELRDVVNDMPGSRIDIITTDKFDASNQPSGTTVVLLIKILNRFITPNH